MKRSAGNHKLVLIVAGEASGDLHGSNLVLAMKGWDSAIRFRGIGGKKMENAGVNILTSASDMAVVGLTEVLPKLYTIIKTYFRLKNLLKRDRPDLLILIDYPDFNLHLALAAKRINIPVLYYISPQIWAWRRGRIKKIAGRVDRLAVILPFEKDFYAGSGIDVEYVGHPLIDTIPHDFDRNRDKILKELGFEKDCFIVGLLPGSRKEEINNLLMPMIKTVEILSSHYHNLKCVLPLAPSISREVVEKIVSRSYVEIKILPMEVFQCMGACDLALVASGTATLETAIMEVPMIIVYRVTPLSYWIGKMVVDVPYIGLVNLVANEEVVPELVQKEVSPPRMAEVTLAMLENAQSKEEIRNKLRLVSKKLGRGGASERTAEIAMEMMNKIGSENPDR